VTFLLDFLLLYPLLAAGDLTGWREKGRETEGVTTPFSQEEPPLSKPDISLSNLLPNWYARTLHEPYHVGRIRCPDMRSAGQMWASGRALRGGRNRLTPDLLPSSVGRDWRPSMSTACVCIPPPRPICYTGSPSPRARVWQFVVYNTHTCPVHS
jgi:hypothetical protein